MNESTRNEMQKDFWRFMIVGSLLFSVFCILVKGYVPTERMPFRYYMLAGAASIAVEILLYFTIRNWSTRSKTRVVWLIGFLWLAVCLLHGRF